MKVALAPRYRSWMLLLFPTTLGLGTAALWLRSLNWPLSIDDAGLMLRSRRRVDWRAINKIGVKCSYLDGQVSEIHIHDRAGTSKIPVNGLRDGQEVVGTILSMFEQRRRAPALRRRRPAEAESSQGDVDVPARESVRRAAPVAGAHENSWSDTIVEEAPTPAFDESAQEVEAASSPAVDAAAAATGLTELWPLMMIVFGVALTAAWIAGLFWLFMFVFSSLV